MQAQQVRQVGKDPRAATDKTRLPPRLDLGGPQVDYNSPPRVPERAAGRFPCLPSHVNATDKEFTWSVQPHHHIALYLSWLSPLPPKKKLSTVNIKHPGVRPTHDRASPNRSSAQISREQTSTHVPPQAFLLPICASDRHPPARVIDRIRSPRESHTQDHRHPSEHQRFSYLGCFPPCSHGGETSTSDKSPYNLPAPLLPAAEMFCLRR